MLLNFLHPFGFICRLPPVGFSTTSCVYVVSISEFPLQQLLVRILSHYLNSPDPVTGQKKIIKVQKASSAYNNGDPSHSYGSKVHKAGARAQKTETGVKNKYPLCPNEFLQIQSNSSRSIEIIIARSRKHTCKSSTFFMPPSPKKYGQVRKHVLYRSKKGVS